MPLIPALTLAAVAAAGYGAGRLRPVRRFVDWNWDRTMHGFGRGQDSVIMASMDGVAWIVMHPVLSVRALRKGPQDGAQAKAPEFNPATFAASPGDAVPAPDQRPGSEA